MISSTSLDRVDILAAAQHPFNDTREAYKADQARSLYYALSAARPEADVLASSRRFLDAAVQDVDTLECDLPETPDGLDAWIEHNTRDVGERYQAYLAARKAGGPRQYFGSKAHALYFLKTVAPTKTVDGAWLFGLVRHWNDSRFSNLIRIYLEELGNGVPDKNHVVLYKKLLATHGCERWDNLDDVHYVQGAIQLALAFNAERFLPEIIGFNLGYEQLPLHLLITAYELNELGIDPTYFTLHVTVDNADTGHAKNALSGLREAWPVVGDGARFYERVRRGYMLNMLGAGTNAVIAGFDLKAELLTILREKSGAGKQVHSDYCRVAGRTVNQWLADPAGIPAFLQALEQAGWIKRGQPPENSRFWNLLQGDRAEMFGVFSSYELQVIHDWIAGDGAASIPVAVLPASAACVSSAASACGRAVQSDGQEGPAASGVAATQATGGQRVLSFRARQRLLESLAQRGSAEKELMGSEAPAAFSADFADDGLPSDFNHEARLLEQAMRRSGSREETMALLADLISPARHHTAAGLKATRLFTRMLG